MRREFLQLGKEWDPSKHLVGGWFASEKLDGHRAFWDGGTTKDIPAVEVPWANTSKDGRLKEEQVSTGLWSRYGKVIHCPPGFTEGWPSHPLDLELWAGHGQFQKTSSIVKNHSGTMKEWGEVKAVMLDCPSWWQILEDGDVKAPAAHWDYLFVRSGIVAWLRGRGIAKELLVPRSLDPGMAFGKLKEIKTNTLGYLVQEKLPFNEKEARARVEEKMDAVLKGGGEGLVLRHPTKPWFPKRVDHVLKVKPCLDAEAVVTGMTWGRETDKGSRHLGRMGALVVRYEGKRLELSGFTDEEREVQQVVPGIAQLAADPRSEVGHVPDEALTHQGEDATSLWEPKMFPRGTVVTFKYRELSVDGIPKEARFFRKRVD